ncbi:unnamed protein product, partial [Owenia fusiformis]
TTTSALATTTIDGSCGVFTTQTGTLTSPNYPSNYPFNMICIWTIHVTGGSVRIQFIDFDVQFKTGCMFDNVRVYDGDVQIARLCGTMTDINPGPYISTGSVARVRLFSDNNKSHKGYSLTWATI